MPISIDMLANVQPFLRGTKDVEGALEDVADSLDDVARDAQRSGDKIERELSSSVDDVGDSTEKLERKFKDLRDTVQRESKAGGDAMARSYKKATDDSKESLDEFKSEANSTAKESAASFDGSAESIVDAFQEVAANAFAGFGPAGAAAGIAAALGIGAITAEFQRQQEEAEETKQAIRDAYQVAIEEGRNYVDQMTIQERVLDLLQSDRADTIRETAKKIGVDLNTVLRAEAGDYEALQAVIAATEQAQQDRFDAADRRAGTNVRNIDTEIGALAGVLSRLNSLKAEHDRNRQAAADYTNFVKSSEREVTDATRRQAAGVALIRDGYNAIPRRVSTTVTATADTAAADRAMREFTSRRYRIKLDVEGRAANGQRII